MVFLCSQGGVLPDPVWRECDAWHSHQVHDRWCATQRNPTSQSSSPSLTYVTVSELGDLIFWGSMGRGLSYSVILKWMEMITGTYSAQPIQAVSAYRFFGHTDIDNKDSNAHPHIHKHACTNPCIPTCICLPHTHACTYPCTHTGTHLCERLDLQGTCIAQGSTNCTLRQQ